MKEENFPKDHHQQKFSVIYFKGHFLNGETYERKYLFQALKQHILFSVQNIFNWKKDHKIN